MKNYHINKNRAGLSNEDILQGKNFFKLLKNYNALKIPFYKTGKFMTGASLLVVAAAVSLILIFDQNEIPTIKPFINPPIAKADVPENTFLIEAEKDTTILYKTGSKIHFPTNAFKEENGNLAKGKVEIKYREFHDQKDLFLSGIPMTYDSGGVVYTFESAGMISIDAFQNGKKLFTNPNALIQISMVSNTAEDRFNTYFLDTTERKWKFINQDNFDESQNITANQNSSDSSINAEPIIVGDTSLSKIELAKLRTLITECEQPIKAIEKTKPIAPVKQIKERPKFTITVDPKEFPEIALYKGTKFQVKDVSTYDANKAKIEWEDVTLKKGANNDYEVTFKKGSNSYTVAASPVLDEQNYAAAQKVYEQKFIEYKKTLADRKVQQEKVRADLEQQSKAIEEQIKNEIANQKEQVKMYEAKLLKSELIYRTFSINNFGTWNCDCPMNMPKGALVIANFKDENGKTIPLQTFYLIEKGRNALFSYYTQNGMNKQFSFNPEKENMLWAVTNDNKLALVDVANFKAQQKQSGELNFKMKLIEKEFASCDEVKKYLEI